MKILDSVLDVHHSGMWSVDVTYTYHGNMVLDAAFSVGDLPFLDRGALRVLCFLARCSNLSVLIRHVGYRSISHALTIWQG